MPESLVEQQSSVLTQNDRRRAEEWGLEMGLSQEEIAQMSTAELTNKKMAQNDRRRAEKPTGVV